MAAQGLLLGMGIIAGIVAAVSFVLVRAELMFPGFWLFVNSDGTGSAPDGRLFGIIYLLISAASVFGAATALGALAGSVIHPALGWAVMIVFVLGGFWALFNQLPGDAALDMPRGDDGWSRWISTAALVPFTWLMVVVAMVGRGVLRVWSGAGVVCSMLVGLIAIATNRLIASDPASFAETHLARAADFGPLATCLAFGLVLAVATHRRVDTGLGRSGLAIVMAALTVVSLLVVLAMFVELGRRGMPVWYGDYPSDFAPANFWASLSGFALIFFTVVGMTHVFLLPRARPQAEIFQ